MTLQDIIIGATIAGGVFGVITFIEAIVLYYLGNKWTTKTIQEEDERAKKIMAEIQRSIEEGNRRAEEGNRRTQELIEEGNRRTQELIEEGNRRTQQILERIDITIERIDLTLERIDITTKEVLGKILEKVS